MRYNYGDVAPNCKRCDDPSARSVGKRKPPVPLIAALGAGAGAGGLTLSAIININCQ